MNYMTKEETLISKGYEREATYTITKSMTESEMQEYANTKEGYEVEFLYEYAKANGYEVILENEGTENERYIFKKPSIL